MELGVSLHVSSSAFSNSNSSRITRILCLSSRVNSKTTSDHRPRHLATYGTPHSKCHEDSFCKRYGPRIFIVGSGTTLQLAGTNAVCSHQLRVHPLFHKQAWILILIEQGVLETNSLISRELPTWFRRSTLIGSCLATSAMNMISHDVRYLLQGGDGWPTSNCHA